MDTSARWYLVIARASLILGPALMSVGDLLHPTESWDPATQVAIIATSASRWYSAHLLLFIGYLLFVPGILALTEKVMLQRVVIGYTARVLLILSVGALSANFVFEMLIGRFLENADQAAAVLLAQTFHSRVFLAIVPGLLAFFIGTGLAAVVLASEQGPFRLPAFGLMIGAILILGEIILAEVRLSQIGNIICLFAGIGFARALNRQNSNTTAYS